MAHNRTRSNPDYPSLLKGSLPVFKDGVPDDLNSMVSLCDRVKNLIDVVDDEHLRDRFSFVFDPVSAYLKKIDLGRWEELRRLPVAGSPVETQGHTICKHLTTLLDVVREKGAHRVELHSAAIASLFRDCLIHDLKNVREIIHSQVRVISEEALSHCIQLAMYVRDLTATGPGVAQIKAISALQLSFLLADSEKDSYNLYAVKLQYLEQQMQHLLSQHDLSNPIIGVASNRRLQQVAADAPPVELDHVHRDLETVRPLRWEISDARLTEVETTLHHNIRQIGWTTLLASRPLWAGGISSAVLVNQVLFKIYYSRSRTGVDRLNESEHALISIFKEAGFDYELPLANLPPNQLSYRKTTENSVFTPIRR